MGCEVGTGSADELDRGDRAETCGVGELRDALLSILERSRSISGICVLFPVPGGDSKASWLSLSSL